jgi:hypothetical protein
VDVNLVILSLYSKWNMISVWGYERVGVNKLENTEYVLNGNECTSENGEFVPSGNVEYVPSGDV